MTVRNLDVMFNPTSVALIGAGDKQRGAGAVLSRNLLHADFPGDIFFVDPEHESFEGRRCYPDIESLPIIPDLVVIATPPATIPEQIAKLGALGCKAAVVITPIVGKSSDSAAAVLTRAMLEAAKPHLLRIIGPNCLGIMVPGVCLNASFGHMLPLTGNVAFVAQSDAVLSSVLDWATTKDIGFSHFVSLGDMLDVDFGDMLDYLATDRSARAILLYIETLTHSRKFMSAARAAARLKPVIVMKGGRFSDGTRAVSSHTGALSGMDKVYDAAFRRAGILRVMDMPALFNAVETLALTRPLTGDRLAILTNGGGLGVLATDTLIEKGGHLATLAPETLARLNDVLPAGWSHSNPVDIIGDAPGQRYADAMSILFGDKNIDALLIMNAPTAVASSMEAADSVINAVRQQTRHRKQMILASWLGNTTALEARRLFNKNQIPCYETPSDAVRGFMQMVRFQHNQTLLMESVPNLSVQFSPEKERAIDSIKQAIGDGRQWLSDIETWSVLTAYGIPMVDLFIARSPEEAGQIAEAINAPAALKIFSPDIVHKSEVGGVVLNLENPSAVCAAAESMVRRISRLLPDAMLKGFTVQPMVHRPHSRELIAGAFEDQAFGPVIVFGQGGTAVEVIDDKALALPPLNLNLAREVIEMTGVYRLLQGYRDTPAADMDAIALVLIQISQLICDIPEVVELDINPLLVNEGGVLALDARMRVKATQAVPAKRLSIMPYPGELEENVVLPDGQEYILRPIRPEDEASIQALFSSLSPDEIRLRFMHQMKIMTHDLAARLTQIDYDREMALVLEGKDESGRANLYGDVRISADPDNVEAEFAILLKHDITGTGLGPMLVRRIINYAKDKGIRRLYGEVLDDNEPMLRLAQYFGFSISKLPADPGLLRIELNL